MIALVEGASRQKNANCVNYFVGCAIFVIVCVTLKPFADYANAPITIAAFISLFVCLIPTTIGGLLSAIKELLEWTRAAYQCIAPNSGKPV
jgi:K+-transporting ATPase ATPase B chain